MGKKVVDFYFDDKLHLNDRARMILKLAGDYKTRNQNIEFLNDGLFCEFGYIYNQESDTLEIYRGFFEGKQAFGTKNEILNALEDIKKEQSFCHLIMIIDRKKHTKEQVLKAFMIYHDRGEVIGDKDNPYPEREIIPLEVPKNYVLLV